jgi:ATP synthase F1 delta subunit
MNGVTMTKLTITTSVELSDQEKQELENKLAKKYEKFKTEYYIDDELIGGIIIFDGDKVYDGSIRNQLERMREQIYK